MSVPVKLKMKGGTREKERTHLTWTLAERAWSKGPAENWSEELNNPEECPEVIDTIEKLDLKSNKLMVSSNIPVKEKELISKDNNK